MPEMDNDITKILVGIGRLEVKADTTNDHLAKLNGSVRTLYDRADTNKDGISALELKLLTHEKDCPGLKTIQEINRKLDSGDFHGSLEVRQKLEEAEKKLEDAAKKESEVVNEWKKELLIPFLKWVLVALFTLMVIHADDFVKGLFK
jgi:hypothetical protein